jgi:hypothetical protein
MACRQIPTAAETRGATSRNEMASDEPNTSGSNVDAAQEQSGRTLDSVGGSISDTAPPARRSLIWLACLILALIVPLSLVVYLYDQRLAEANAATRTIDFYPDISRYLIFGAFFALMLLGCIVRWNKISATAGPNRAMLAVFASATLTLVFVGLAGANFYDPKPKIVLARDRFYCGWRVKWTDVSNIDKRWGGRFREYLRIQFAPGRSPFRDQRSSDSCEIDGLTVDDSEVYATVYKQWQMAKSDMTQSASSTGVLRGQLEQIPVGSSRETVTAVLGEPTITAPGYPGQVSFYGRRRMVNHPA